MNFRNKLLSNIVLFIVICILQQLSDFHCNAETGKVSDLDTARINQLNSKALDNYHKNPDSAFIHANRSLKLSRNLHYTKGIAGAYTALAYTHLLNFSRNDSAHQYFQLAYNIYRNINDTKGLGLVCYGFGYLYSFSGNLEESEKYMQRALKYCKLAGFNRGIYNTYSALSYINKQYKDYGKAYAFIDSGIAVASETQDQLGLADLYNSKGNLFKDQALFQQAIDTYFEALRLWEQINDSAGIAIAYGSIGNVYYFQKDYQKALKYFYKKLPVSMRDNDMWEVSKTYASLASVYNVKHQHDSAMLYLHKGLQLNRSMNFPSGIADIYYKLANTDKMIANYDSALVFIGKAIIIARNINDKAKLAQYYVLLGEIQRKLGNKKESLINIEKGYGIAKELGLPFVISDATGLLSKIYAENGNYSEAYRNLLEHKSMQDSINKDENIKKVTQLEMQYEFDKKQHKMEFEAHQERLAHEAAIRQQHMYLYGVIIFFILIVLFGFLFFRQRSLHDKFRAIELEQKLLLTQMNPHFIFNSLCAIQNFMVENDAKEAGHFLTRFSMLMRHILENSRSEFILIADEIDTLKNYLDIQQLRFGKPFNYDLHVDESIDPETYAIPPMLAQPFIENAIEHGLASISEKGKIDIGFYLSGSLIKLVITDNGIGIKHSLMQKSTVQQNRNSVATMLTRERLARLKQRYKGDISLQIDDLSQKNKRRGTRVILQIPFKRIYG